MNSKLRIPLCWKVLDAGRCSRLVEWSSRDSSLPSLQEVLRTITESVIVKPQGSKMDQEIRWAVQHAYVARLIALADAPDATPTVRAAAQEGLSHVFEIESKLWVGDQTGNASMIASQIMAFRDRPMQSVTAPVQAPAALPGAPIGMFGCGD